MSSREARRGGGGAERHQHGGHGGRRTGEGLRGEDGQAPPGCCSRAALNKWRCMGAKAVASWGLTVLRYGVLAGAVVQLPTARA